MLEIYRQHIKTALAIQIQYRVSMVIWMIYLVLEPLIFLVVWQSAAGEGSISGYGAREFAGYYITLLVVTHFTQMWHMWEYQWLIQQGLMSIRLIRPLHPVHVDLTQNLAYKLLMLIVIIPAIILMIIAFQPVLHPHWWSLLLFVPSVAAAGALAFFFGWVIAMAAFWTTRIEAINQVYFLSMLFFSGQIAPLDLLPDGIRLVANLLPFYWMVGFPVEMMIGQRSVQESVIGFGIQMVWLTASIGILALIWKQAVKRYSAVGG